MNKSGDPMKKVVAIAILLIMLTGCATTLIVDDLILVRAISYDLADEEKLAIKISVPLFEDPTSEKVEFYETTTTSSKLGKKILNQETPNPIVSGQAAVVLFGEEFGKDGVFDIVDTFHRDPVIGNRLKLAVVKGNAGEVLSEELTEVGKQPGVYIENLILQNERDESLPKTNLHLFMKYYYSEGRDPYLPLLEKKDSHVKVNGIALFKDDQFVTTIPYESAFVFRLLTKEFYKKGSIEVSLNEENEETITSREGMALIENVYARTKFNVQHSNNTPEVNIVVNMQGIIREYKGNTNVKSKKVLKEAERIVEKRIKSKMNGLIKEFQAAHIDPVGFGDHVRAYWRDWNKQEWDTLYPELKVNVDVNVKIISSGIIE